ncbi:anti-sigma regulatory factor (Ser/Thr protein kinase) [Aneurinibacillus soli]|uniref:Serine-protein kinase RsbW n=1 Tax=Aneurinibacillus soli TaxID=1500254 RepID=A0A0U5BF53_9BACL|nr:ATP-binding protein [Aneurinibacillus soli]PYE60893.1 anti-sigma regulatory factor (Ser/Thr protein kinase) [Aneurinibacillus soli]BAU26798.1 Serine-protein kinase RsbW [Aneurinibacillus soli]
MRELQLVCIKKQELPFIREQISTFIRETVPDDSVLLEIAVNEAINNAMRYGNRGEPRSVTIRLHSTGKRLVVRVRDDGEGFKGNERLQKLSYAYYSTHEELYKESGRGLYIMKTVTDYIKYNEKGNEVMLVKYTDSCRKSSSVIDCSLVALGDNS